MEFFKEYFSWQFDRAPEGFLSWQHLTVVTIAFVLVVLLAWRLASRRRHEDRRVRMKVVVVSAIVLDGFEILKLVVHVVMSGSFATLLGSLPLFLCSIPLIVLPIAAFAKGRLQQASLDFVLMFGLLGGFLGTYMAGNIYSIFPVIHFEPMVSLVTHMTSAFASLYIGLAGLGTMEKRNMSITTAILAAFMVAAYAVDQVGKVYGFQDNYMFLSRSDGTPFFILELIFGSGTAGYTISVAVCMWAYLGLFYLVAAWLVRHRQVRSRADA
jgi:hypothetical protein